MNSCKSRTVGTGVGGLLLAALCVASPAAVEAQESAEGCYLVVAGSGPQAFLIRVVVLMTSPASQMAQWVSIRPVGESLRVLKAGQRLLKRTQSPTYPGEAKQSNILTWVREPVKRAPTRVT